MPHGPSGLINLDAHDRFVPTAALQAAYIRYEGSRNLSAPAHVRLDDGRRAARARRRGAVVR